MKHLACAALLAATLTATLSACTTTPEPCTAEWVEWRTETVLTKFARSNLTRINRLRKFAKTVDEGDVSPMAVLAIPSLISDIQVLADRFEESVLPEVAAAVDQCGTTERLVPAFTNFLRREGVDDELLEWVEALSGFVIENDI